jgi:hypothetical protein
MMRTHSLRPLHQLHVATAIVIVSALACACSTQKSDSATQKSDSGYAPDAPGVGSFTPPPDGGVIPPSGAPLDPNTDNDNDGWRGVDNDCNDRDPNINPGAYDVEGDRVDNDCDGVVDNGNLCDDSAYAPSELANDDPMAFARAMQLCGATTDNPPLPQKRWGVIHAAFLRSDDTPLDRANQHGLMATFGLVTKPVRGSRFANLSTWLARTPDMNDFTLDPFPRTNLQPPAGFSNIAIFCQGDPLLTGAVDPVKLRFQIRVPTNARGFHFDFDYLTGSFPAPDCGLAGEVFVALLDSKEVVDATHHGNIAFDSDGLEIVPSTKFLRSCIPSAASLFAIPPPRAYDCPDGTSALVGTGFDLGKVGTTDNLLPHNGGAATGWLETRASVVPAEIITIDFLVWGNEETVLLDNWHWDATGASAPTTSPVIQ